MVGSQTLHQPMKPGVEQAACRVSWRLGVVCFKARGVSRAVKTATEGKLQAHPQGIAHVLLR